MLTRSQVRELDRRAVEECGMSSLVLMENAGRGCVDVLQQLLQQHSPQHDAAGPIVIVCGKGNNAGDGFVIARHLEIRGVRSIVFPCAPQEQLQGDAASNFHILRHTNVEVIPLAESEFDFAKFDTVLSGASWIVDALLGTGTQGAPRPPLDDVIRRLNDSPATKLAVDLPSGLDCDTGCPADPTFRADHTCTFAALKPGFTNEQAQAYLGRVHLCDIGTPPKLAEQVAQSVSRSPL